jgi:hypothetical protein
MKLVVVGKPEAIDSNANNAEHSLTPMEDRMKFVSVGSVPPLLTSFLFISLNALTACGGGGGPIIVPNYTLSVSPQPASIPVNGTVTFSATTNGPSNDVTWVIVGSGDMPMQNLGSPTSAVGATFVYTAPPAPPIWQDGAIPQGSVAVRALGNSNEVQFNVAITTPSVTTGLLLNTTTVALGQTLSILAYAVGSTNNAVAMQVNGVTGGSTTYGTITPYPSSGSGYGYYTYTAPATMPMTGNTVTVTVISLADPTKSSSVTITLTSS